MALCKGRHNIVPSQAGFTQDMGGRVTHYPPRSSERPRPAGSATANAQDVICK